MSDSADPEGCHAIVVGVEAYDGAVGSLDGPALDACRFAAWLVRRGVPASNVALYLSPLEKNTSAVALFLAELRASHQLLPQDLQPLQATSSLVRNELVEGLLHRKGARELLFFYWSGHGVLDRKRNRRLVYVDAHPGEVKNLDLAGLRRRLLSDQVSGFKQQIFIVDACALIFEDPVLGVTLVDHELPAGGPDLRRDQVEMLSSTDGQVSANLGGGVFTRELLQELEKDAAWPPDLDAVAQQLRIRFEALRRKGLVSQAPRSFHYSGVGFGFEQLEVAPNLDFAPQLPSRPLCLGRATQVADLVQTLLAAAPPPTPILGGPGIGKSTVAVDAAHDIGVAARFGSRRYFVRLDATRTADAARAEVAATLGILPSPALSDQPMLTKAVQQRLTEGPTLLILDNAETPWWTDAESTETLLCDLATVPGVALVVTIRGAERPWSVRWRSSITIPPLEPIDAKEVFLTVAGEGFRSDARLDPLIEALDGQPLAITLMAHRAEGEATLESIWDKWQEEGTLMLADVHHSGPSSSFQTSFEISIHSPRMSDGARRLLSLLGVLPDGIASADLGTVLPSGGNDWAAALRKAGLAADGLGSGRLSTLAPVREHVKANHPPMPADFARAVAHYSQLAAELGLRAGATGGAEAIQKLGSELENVELSLLCGLAGSEPRTAFDGILGLARFMRFSGLGSTRVLSRALEAARSTGDVSAEATWIEKLGDAALFRSNHEDARGRYAEALVLYQRQGNLSGKADCLVGLGEISKRRADYRAALEDYEEAIEIYRGVGNTAGEANCILRLADLALLRGEFQGTNVSYERARLLFQQLGDILGQANCALRFGDLSLAQKDFVAAHAYYEGALALYCQVGARLGEGNCLLNLGEIALERGDHEGARQRYEEAVRRFRLVADILGEANSINSLGHVALALRNEADARINYERALQLYRRIPEPVSIGTSEQQLARLASTPEERRRHVLAAREVWASVARIDLISELDTEFGRLT